VAWQEAKAVVRVAMLGTRQRHPCVDQLQRAALSVQLNIAEGYAFRSSKRFRNHLDIAHASSVETAELLELAEELCLFPQGELTEALKRWLIKSVRSG
jgi:four helix bundle protein